MATHKDIHESWFNVYKNKASIILSTILGVLKGCRMWDWNLRHFSRHGNSHGLMLILYIKMFSHLDYVGHGFKLSPVVGKVIAELVTEEAPSHDLHPFRISRFITPQSSVTMNIGHD